MMRVLVGLAIGLVTVVFLAGTMMLNYEFGTSFGRSDVEQKLFGWIAVGFDVLKAVLPIVIWNALRKWRIDIALISIALWVGCLAISLASAAGVSASVRARASEAAAQHAALAESRRQSLARKQQRRQAIGSIESASVVERRIAELKARHSWRASKQCTEIAGKEQREQCGEVLAASRRLEEAQEAARLDEEIGALAAAPHARTEGTAGAAQADILARLLGMPRNIVEDSLSLWWVATIEIVACFGLLLATSHAEASPGMSRPVAATGDGQKSTDDKREEVGRPLEFATQALAPQKGARLSYDDAFAAYTAWCSREGKRATSRDQLVTELIRLGRDEKCWTVEERGIAGVTLAGESMRT